MPEKFVWWVGALESDSILRVWSRQRQSIKINDFEIKYSIHANVVFLLSAAAHVPAVTTPHINMYRCLHCDSLNI